MCVCVCVCVCVSARVRACAYVRACACVCAHFSARTFYRLEAVKGLIPDSRSACGRDKPNAERELILITSRFPGFPCKISDCLPAKDNSACQKTFLLFLTFENRSGDILTWRMLWYIIEAFPISNSHIIMYHALLTYVIHLSTTKWV